MPAITRSATKAETLTIPANLTGTPINPHTFTNTATVSITPKILLTPTILHNTHKPTPVSTAPPTQ
jgi:hypothetical protein